MNPHRPFHEDAIREMYDWRDPARYEWVVADYRDHKGIWRAVAPILGIGVIIPFLSYWATAIVTTVVVGLATHFTNSAASLDWHDDAYTPSKVFVGTALNVLLLVVVLVTLWRKVRGTLAGKSKAESDSNEVLTCSVGIMAYIVRHLTISGFEGSTYSFSQWMGFYVQHAISAISLNFSDVFELTLSNIQPHTWQARLGATSFEFSIVSGLVAFLSIVYKKMFDEERFYGTVTEFFFKYQSLLERDLLVLERRGKIEPMKERDRMVMLPDFLNALDGEEFTRTK